MPALDTIDLILSFAVTWLVGLTPPVVIRYVIARRPMGKLPAVGICALFWIFNVVLFTAMGSQSTRHTALMVVALVSYWILRRGASLLPAPALLRPVRPASGETPPVDVEAPENRGDERR